MKVTKAPLAVTFDAQEAALFRFHAKTIHRTIADYLEECTNSLLQAALDDLTGSDWDEESRRKYKARFASVAAAVAKRDEEDAARARRRAARAG